MGDIKRQINSITDLKRDAVNVNFVYRGTTLVWQRGAITRWLTSGFNIILDNVVAGESKYFTSGFNIKLK